MRRSALWASFAAVLLLLPALLSGQWARTGERGSYGCRNGETVVESPYPSSSADTTKACNGMGLLGKFLGINEALAVSVRFTLKRNDDGSFDTDYPDGTKNTGATVQPLTLGVTQTPSSTSALIPMSANCSGGTLPYTYYIRKGLGPGSLAALANSATLFDGPGYTATGLTASTTYYFDAYCADAMAVESVKSNVVVVTTPAGDPGDTTAPTVPGNCVAVSASNTTSTLGLNCDDSTDAVGVTQYTCTVGTATLSPDTPVAFLYSYVSLSSECLFTNLAETQPHYMRMSAQDLATNSSAASTRVYDTTATTTPTPSGNIIFRETFESMATGNYLPVPNVWSRGDQPFGCCQILNTTPVASGFGKYFRPYNFKSGTTNFRSEYWYIGTPYSSPRVFMSNVGSGGFGIGADNYASDEYWYGYYVCIDKSEITEGYGIYVNQWHTDDEGVYDAATNPNGSPGGETAGFNPMFALIAGINGQLQVYIEGSDEAPPVNPAGFVGGSVLTNVPTPGGGSYVGKCFPVIWQLKMDSRVSTNSSAGILRLWLGSSSTAVFEWTNKQVGHEDRHKGNRYMPYFNIGGYESRWRDGWGTEGEEWEARYDNVTIMDSTGSRAAMYNAIVNDPD